jgi:hypothetical protein
MKEFTHQYSLRKKNGHSRRIARKVAPQSSVPCFKKRDCLRLFSYCEKRQALVSYTPANYKKTLDMSRKICY